MYVRNLAADDSARSAPPGIDEFLGKVVRMSLEAQKSNARVHGDTTNYVENIGDLSHLCTHGHRHPKCQSPAVDVWLNLVSLN